MIIGSKLIFIEKLTSTNSYAADLLKKANPQEGTVIYTNFQTDGRGQTGNTWESKEGKNLLISIILYPLMVKPGEQFIISKTISLGICDFLKKHITNISIKWPNDIYVKNDKIAGILIENSIIRSRIESVVAGIGLNINQREFFSNATNPVSLSLLTGKNYNINHCLSNLVIDLDKRYKQLLYEKRSLIDNDYLSNLYRLHEWSEYKDTCGIFEGRIISVSDNGRIQIEDRMGRIYEYAFKEVDFI